MRRTLARNALRISLGLALGLAPLWCAASWFKVGSTANVTLYMDRKSIEKVDDNIYNAWEIQDLKTPDPEGVRSRRYINEVDCEHKMHRIGSVTSYSGPMLTGKKLFDVDDFGYWRPIPRNGLFALSYILHCGR